MLRVGTANVFKGLNRKAARQAVETVAPHCDVLGLQEWVHGRAGILHKIDGFRFRRPLRGGGPIGVRTGRFRIEKVRSVVLHKRSRVDKPPKGKKRRRWLSPTRATLLPAIDLATNKRFLFIDYHLTAGVQQNGAYRRDQPLRVARHMAERRALGDLVHEYSRLGYIVVPVGDSNFDRFHLPGLISCWTGRHGGTLGGRAVDCIHAPIQAERVHIFASESDHRHPVATYTY